MTGVIASDAQEIALFVFIPFCRIKCTYCDFNAYANLARVMEPYAHAVAQEIRACPQALRDRPRLRARSVYFGGGTPSLVPTAHIDGILAECRDSFDLLPDAEITLEANPGTVDLEKLQALRSLGVNRLSLGVQSFDEAVVRRLNRGHTAGQAIETFKLARKAGFDNVNLDLIYGLPLQSLADWRSDLERALTLEPEHLSLYALKVEQGTGLEYQIARGKYPRPNDDLAADMYELSEATLESAGYEHYEISNWARRAGAAGQNGLRSRHNLAYWHNEPYLGFGAGAHSFFSRVRFWNVLSPVEYIERIRQGSGVVAESEVIDRELEMAETMILGLRLGEGVSFKGFQERFGEDARQKYAGPLRETEGFGLVQISNARVTLTARGRLLSNEVFWRFLP